MATIINKTPHPIVMNSGTIYEPIGDACRVGNTYSEADENGFVTMGWGEIENLPSPKADTYYIVSSIVKSAAPNRTDLLVPATNHKDCVRSEKGYIISVPFLCK